MYELYRLMELPLPFSEIGVNIELNVSFLKMNLLIYVLVLSFQPINDCFG